MSCGQSPTASPASSPPAARRPPGLWALPACSVRWPPLLLRRPLLAEALIPSTIAKDASWASSRRLAGARRS
eukprot:8468786-Alexandrium_andersonii.AAC.1